MKPIINLLFFSYFLIGSTAVGHSQTLTGKLANPLKGMKQMDIVIWPLGLDRSITIGQLTADGSLEFTFPPKEDFLTGNGAQQMVVNDFEHALAFNCLGKDEMAYPDGMAARMGPISLWYKGRYAGVLFPVSGEALIPWLEDEAYNDPVKGTFYQLVYLARAATLDTQCTTSYRFSDSIVVANYDHQLQLEAGLNFVAYDIEEIHKMGQRPTSSKPNKVTIRNIKDGSDDIKWFAKYF